MHTRVSEIPASTGSPKIYDKQARAARLIERYLTPELIEATNASFDRWGNDQASRPGSGLSLVPYDVENYPGQSLIEAKTPARNRYPLLPDAIYYQGVRKKILKSVGKIAFSQLHEQWLAQPTSDTDPTPLLDTLKQNRTHIDPHSGEPKPKSTIFVSPHMKLSELAYLDYLRFYMMRDRDNIDKRGVILNKLISRQKYKGGLVYEHMTAIGHDYWSIPEGPSSRKFEVPDNAMKLLNGLVKIELAEDMASRNLYELDAALTGSEVKPFDAQGNRIMGSETPSVYVIPEVQKGSARLIEGFEYMLPTALIQDPRTGMYRMHIGNLMNIPELLASKGSKEVIDQTYGEFADIIHDFTGTPTVYGDGLVAA